MITESIAGVLATTLALMFMLSASQKFQDVKGVTYNLRDFGVPSLLAPAVAHALPVIEFAVAFLLLLPHLSSVGAALIVGLLATFTIAIITALAKGKRPNCNCFGHKKSPISGYTVIRNLIWIGVACLVYALSDSFLENGLVLFWFRFFEHTNPAVGVLLLFVVAVQIIILFRLLKHHGRLLLRVDNIEAQFRQDNLSATLSLGQEAPAFSALTANGEIFDSAGFINRNRELVLLFVGAECDPCRELLKQVVASQTEIPLLVIFDSPPNFPLGTVNYVIQQHKNGNHLYGIVATPSAIRIVNSKINSTLAVGSKAIEKLLPFYVIRSERTSLTSQPAA